MRTDLCGCAGPHQTGLPQTLEEVFGKPPIAFDLGRQVPGHR
jgi:hypothetical protein